MREGSVLDEFCRKWKDKGKALNSWARGMTGSVRVEGSNVVSRVQEQRRGCAVELSCDGELRNSPFLVRLSARLSTRFCWMMQCAWLRASGFLLRPDSICGSFGGTEIEARRRTQGCEGAESPPFLQPSAEYSRADRKSQRSEQREGKRLFTFPLHQNRMPARIPQLTLFTSPTCTLCTVAKADLHSLQRQIPFDLSIYDIRSSAPSYDPYEQTVWRRLYQYDVPVLHRWLAPERGAKEVEVEGSDFEGLRRGGRVAKHRIDKEKLLRQLREWTKELNSEEET